MKYFIVFCIALCFPPAYGFSDHEWPASEVLFTVPYDHQGEPANIKVRLAGDKKIEQVTVEILGEEIKVPIEDLEVAPQPLLNRARLLFGGYYAFYLKGLPGFDLPAKPTRFYLEIEYGTNELHGPAEGRARKTIIFVFSQEAYEGYRLTTSDGKGGVGSTILIDKNKSSTN